MASFWAENCFIYGCDHTINKFWSCWFFENVSFYEYAFSLKRQNTLENENKDFFKVFTLSG